jgi:4-amino-4-deoxy-L-arabinose transferase-like glycosyltransferase
MTIIQTDTPENRSGAGPIPIAALAVGMGILAVIFKIVLLAQDAFPFNADEAVVALMARHILAGELPVFFYGQAYMGSLDALLVAAAFRVWGESITGVRLVQCVLYGSTVATAVVLAWRLHRKLWLAGAAGLLLAVPSVNTTLYTTVSLGGYGEALLIGAGLLLAAWESWCAPRGWLSALAWGLLAGVGIWAFGLVLVFVVPSAALIAMSLRRIDRRAAVRRVLLTVAAAIVGLLPWLGWTISNGPAAAVRELAGSAIAGVGPQGLLASLAYRGLNLLLFGATVVVGLRPPWSVEWLSPWLAPLAVGFWLAVAAYMVAALRRRDGARPGRWMLAGVIGMTLLGFLVTPFGADPSGRYFLPLMIPMALFAAELLVAIRERYGRAWAALPLAAILLFHLSSAARAVSAEPGFTTQFDAATRIDHEQDAALVRFLLAEGETRGYTNYWVAYPLAFLSQEQLLFVPELPYHPDLRYTARDNRYPPYAEAVASAPQVAYITTGQARLEERLRAGFRQLGVQWREAALGDYHVFYDLSRPVRPEMLDLAP